MSILKQGISQAEAHAADMKVRSTVEGIIADVSILATRR